MRIGNRLLGLRIENGEAGHLQLPFLSMADSPAHVFVGHASAISTCVATRKRGTSTRPLELAIQNQTDRSGLAIDSIDRMPRFQVKGAGVREALLNHQIDAAAASRPGSPRA